MLHSVSLDPQSAENHLRIVESIAKRR